MITNDGRKIDNPINIWLLGNTGVRNPWRIQEGLKIYANSSIVGELRGVENALKFRNILAEANIIETDNSKDETGSIGRKWRLAFNQFGFTYPEVKEKFGFSQVDIGPVDCITPIGRAFINADTVSSMQECFLRALTVPMQPLNAEVNFSPFRWSLAIMMKLEERTGSTLINFIEYVTCVQTTNPLSNIDEIIDKILNIREARKISANKKAFDKDVIHQTWLQYPLKELNFRDYGDMNLRYMTTSGIVQRVGRGIGIVPEKHALAIELAKESISTESLKDRYIKLCKGAPLPTDDVDTAKKVLQDLIFELNALDIKYELPDIPLNSAANINTARGTLERHINDHKEETYAYKQRENWIEIYEYMNLLMVNNGREKVMAEDYSIKVPTSEASAYLEWILWRAFLAIDNLTNKPYEARRFKIDQDFLPVGTATGNGPDMIFEFQEFVFVVEVTLSTNSRQEAMEGEPVRRHVADIVTQYDGKKPVFGIFVANRVDSNTAETFRIGKWYTQNDRVMKLNIIPFTLKQFAEFFKAIFENNAADPNLFITLMNKCAESREIYEAPEWKLQIEENVNYAVAETRSKFN